MKNVLYLDDSQASIVLVRKCLAEAVSVTGVNTISDAIHLTDNQKFDLILVDYQIGTETSFGFVDHLRKVGPHHKQTPIILVTAFRSEGVFFKGSKIGINDYIFKPYPREDLLELVKTYLANPLKRREAKPTHTTAQCISWRIDDRYFQYSPDLMELVEASSWEGAGQLMKDCFNKHRKNATAEITVVTHNIPFFSEK